MDLLEQLAKALGYKVIINDDDGTPTAELSPIAEPDVPSTDAGVIPAEVMKATVLLAQNTSKEVTTLREALGGADGLKALQETLKQATVVINSFQQDQARERDGLVKAILVANAHVFSEDELKAKPVHELRKLVQLAGVDVADVDYSLLEAGVQQNTEAPLAVPQFFLAPAVKK